MILLLRAFHSQIDPSRQPPARRSPVGENAMEFIGGVRPVMVATRGGQVLRGFCTEQSEWWGGYSLESFVARGTKTIAERYICKA